MAAPEAPSTEVPAAMQSGPGVTASRESRHPQPSTTASKRDASGEAVRPPGDARGIEASASTELSAPPKREMGDLPEFEKTEVEVPVIAR
jgi:hypothetical protein